MEADLILVLLRIVQVLLDVLWWIIVIQAIMSWLLTFNVINLYNDTVRAVWHALERITDPIYRPIRKVLPDFGALDLSPLVALLIIYILSTVILPYIGAQLFLATGG
jgi:YggT family protein